MQKISSEKTSLTHSLTKPLNKSFAKRIDSPTVTARKSLMAWILGIAFAVPVWFILYYQLVPFADWVLSMSGMAPQSHLGKAIHFFFYDTPKVFLLLIGMVFLMGIVQSFFSTQRTRTFLSGKKLGGGNTLAALLGVVTPFCSCSAVPLFIGFLSAGVPLGVTFSFLIAAPMVNEVALVLLLGMFGWKVALLYSVLGLLIAIFAGIVIGKLGMEKHLQDWVQEIHRDNFSPQAHRYNSWLERFNFAANHVKGVVGKVWPYIVLGIGIGAGIHGFVPQDFMASMMGKDSWWSIPVAVIMGIPMYTNAAGIIPVVEALISKGAALGTTLAFMMSVIALSLPEILILRKVLKMKLIVTFIATVAVGILWVGYLFNFLL